MQPDRQLLSGDEAIALAARDAGVALGTGYPGTPSTEILEAFAELGGRAQWSPNEKVALEVAIGAAFAGARALCTMKHVGLNVAADPLFTAAYTGVTGALVVVSADDPGMASSQNEQDNRRYAVAAGVPMLEPSDSQEAYDFTLPRHRDLRALEDPGAAPDDHARLPLQDRRAAAQPAARPPPPPTSSATSRGRVMIPPTPGRRTGGCAQKLAEIAAVERDAQARIASSKASPHARASSPRASPSCTRAKPRRKRASSSSA